MAEHDWLDALPAALRRRGLPSDYVDRLVEELRDHAVDAAGVDRLGGPDEILETAVTEYRASSWVGRHPAVALLVAPLAAVFAAWAAFTCVGDGALLFRHELTPWAWTLFLWLPNLLFPWLAIAWADRLRSRAGLPTGWLFAATAVVAVGCLMLATEHVREGPQGRSQAVVVEHRWPTAAPQWASVVAASLAMRRCSRSSPTQALASA